MKVSKRKVYYIGMKPDTHRIIKAVAVHRGQRIGVWIEQLVERHMFDEGGLPRPQKVDDFVASNTLESDWLEDDSGREISVGDS